MLYSEGHRLMSLSETDRANFGHLEYSDQVNTLDVCVRIRVGSFTRYLASVLSQT